MRKRRSIAAGFAVAAGLACAALACASATPQPRAAAGLAAPAPGLGRLVLYRTSDTEATLFHPQLTVDGEPVGELPVGTFLQVDRPPGVHEIAVKKQPNLSAFGGQAPTRPVAVVLAPSGTSYVRFDVNPTRVWVESTLTEVDPTGAQRELERLRQARSED